MRTTRIIFALSACSALMIGPADAEFIGLNIGNSFPATAQNRPLYSDSSSIDLVDDLAVDNPQQSSMLLILEHPIKALPNIRYQGYNFGSTGTSTLGSGSSLNGESSSSGSEVSSTLELSQDDIVLYYELYNNRLNLDLGVDLKRFDGEVSLNGLGNSSVAVDETIPLLYLSARFDLPNSGFYVGANINANIVDLGLSDSDARDSTIMLGYDSGNGIGLEGGIKYFSLQLDNNDDDLNTDLEYDGIYLNGYFNF